MPTQQPSPQLKIQCTDSPKYFPSLPTIAAPTIPVITNSEQPRLQPSCQVLVHQNAPYTEPLHSTSPQVARLAAQSSTQSVKERTPDKSLPVQEEPEDDSADEQNDSQLRMASSPAALALNHPVVVSFITSHAHVSDLPTLCLTTKSFHSSAIWRLYHSLILTNPSTAFLACETLARTPVLTTHVCVLVLGQGRPHVWQALQRTLEVLPRLEAFAIDARGIRLSCVLPLTPSFHFRDLRLCIPWDTQVAAFVCTQTTLQALWILEVAEDCRPSAVSTRLRGTAEVAPPPSNTTAEVAEGAQPVDAQRERVWAICQ